MGDDLLLQAGATLHCTTLEDYITGRPTGANTLGARHGVKRDALTLRWLHDAIMAAVPPDRVLDVGCAYGDHLLMLNAELGKRQDVELIGVDLFETAIARANDFAARVPGYANCRFLVADLTAGLPFEDATFTVVNLADVLEHMPDPAAALAELGRVTRPGETLVIATPVIDSLFKRASRTANRVTGGRLYQRYYAGKGAALDEHGEPEMDVYAGEDHVSELPLAELLALLDRSPFQVEQVEPMSVMSGSQWFDRHPVLLSGLLGPPGFRGDWFGWFPTFN